MIGQKWIRRNELLTIDIKPNENIDDEKPTDIYDYEIDKEPINTAEESAFPQGYLSEIEEIEKKTGKTESEVIKIMRRSVKPTSFRL